MQSNAVISSQLIFQLVAKALKITQTSQDDFINQISKNIYSKINGEVKLVKMDPNTPLKEQILMFCDYYLMHLAKQIASLYLIAKDPEVLLSIENAVVNFNKTFQIKAEFSSYIQAVSAGDVDIHNHKVQKVIQYYELGILIELNKILKDQENMSEPDEFHHQSSDLLSEVRIALNNLFASFIRHDSLAIIAMIFKHDPSDWRHTIEQYLQDHIDPDYQKYWYLGLARC